MVGASLREVFIFIFLHWRNFEELTGQSEPLLPVRHVNASFIHSFIHLLCLNCFKSFNILTHDTIVEQYHKVSCMSLGHDCLKNSVNAFHTTKDYEAFFHPRV